jgi:WD40 repeat protein
MEITNPIAGRSTAVPNLPDRRGWQDPLGSSVGSAAGSLTGAAVSENPQKVGDVFGNHEETKASPQIAPKVPKRGGGVEHLKTEVNDIVHPVYCCCYHSIGKNHVLFNSNGKNHFLAIGERNKNASSTSKSFSDKSLASSYITIYTRNKGVWQKKGRSIPWDNHVCCFSFVEVGKELYLFVGGKILTQQSKISTAKTLRYTDGSFVDVLKDQELVECPGSPLYHHNSIMCCATSISGQHLAIGGEASASSGRMTVYRVPEAFSQNAGLDTVIPVENKSGDTPPGNTSKGCMYCCAFSRDGQHLAVGDSGGAVAIYTTVGASEGGYKYFMTLEDHRHQPPPVFCLEYSLDRFSDGREYSQFLAAGDADGLLQIYSCPVGRADAEGITAKASSPHPRPRVASSGARGLGCGLNALSTSERPHQYTLHVEFHHDGKSKKTRPFMWV